MKPRGGLEPSSAIQPIRCTFCGCCGEATSSVKARSVTIKTTEIFSLINCAVGFLYHGIGIWCSQLEIGIIMVGRHSLRNVLMLRPDSSASTDIFYGQSWN